VGEILLYFYVPIERFFDVTDQENSKTQGKGKNGGKKKKRFFYIHGGSHTRVFSICQERPWANTLVQPSLRRTHSYGNVPYNIKS
jgi:hypothetical protein